MRPSIQDVKRKYEAQLLAERHVVSVGIGRSEDGETVIVVGIERDLPEVRARLPSQLEGYPVRTQVVGQIKAQ